MEKDFKAECNVCGQRYDNWSGSTPCCGALSFIVGDEDIVTKKVSLYTSVGAVILDFSENKEK